MLRNEGCFKKDFYDAVDRDYSSLCDKTISTATATICALKKSEASVNNVKEAMLACGFISPYTTHGMADNAYAKAQLCMLDKGFLADPEVDIFCKKEAYKNRLPACLERQKSNH